MFISCKRHNSKNGFKMSSINKSLLFYTIKNMPFQTTVFFIIKMHKKTLKIELRICNHLKFHWKNRLSAHNQLIALFSVC